MTELYVILILNKLRTFESIPPELKWDVERSLSQKGYDIYGVPFAIKGA